MFPLIAIDLDGTLLGSGHRLSDRTRAAVDALLDSGRQVIIATGRPFDIVRELCAGIRLTSPQITYNGAVVHDPVSDRPLDQTPFPSRSIDPVLDFMRDHDIPAVACALEAIYLDPGVEPSVWVPAHLAPGRPLAELRNGATSELIKIAGDTNPDAIARFRPLAESVFGPSLYVTQTGPRLIEFLNPSVSKGAALRRIAGALGIEQRDILVFGDSHNDLTLFEAAGLRVAMGNAAPEVKAAADRVTLSNNEDGVAVVLEELGMVPRHDPDSG